MELSDKAKEGRRLYMREWRKKNEKKIRDYQREYMREYRARNREKHVKQQNAYWERKADELKEEA